MANRKISDLTALTAPATGDLLPIVDISEGIAADKNKKITYGELLASAPAGSAAAPSFSFDGNPNSGLYSAGADQVAISAGGTGQLIVNTTAITSTLPIVYPLGTAGAPSLYFTGDTNTGIYSPGADQLAISTNGTQRLTVDTAATTSTLPVVHPLGAVGTPSITFTGDLNTGIYSPAADTLAFVEGGVEAMRIDSSGRLGLGTGSPDALLTVNGIGAFGAGAVTTPSIAATGDLNTGFWFPAADTLAASTGGSERLRITSAGLVGIGNTAPSNLLQVGNTSAGGNIAITSSSSGSNGFLRLIGSDGNEKLQIYSETAAAGFYTPASTPLIFFVSNQERGRWDSSGRFLVGTSTARGVSSSTYGTVQVETTSYIGYTVVNNTNDNGGAAVSLGKSRGTSVGSNTVVQNGDDLGSIIFAGADGTDLESQAASIKCSVDATPGANDMPGRLVFSTTADGAASPTERMRINSFGNVGINCTPETKLDVAGQIRAFAAATQDGVMLQGRAGGTSSYKAIITPATLTADRTLTLPDTTGTLITSGDAGTVTGAMLELGAPQVVSLTSTQASTSVTLANVTALVVSLAANAIYEVDCYVTFQSAATTTGLNLGFTSPTGCIPMVEVVVPIVSTAGATSLRLTFPNAASITSGNVVGTGVTAINSNHTARIGGIIKNGSTAGNFQVQFATEVAASAVTLQIGSTMVLTRLA